MRASSSLQSVLRKRANFLHAKQWSALWRGVEGVLRWRAALPNGFRPKSGWYRNSEALHQGC